MENLDLYVDICITVLSMVITIISLITVIITLKQNSRMLEANERPYVVAYLVYDEYSTNFYLCVKNFGKSAALIHKIEINPDLLIHKKHCSETFANTMLAPGQQVHFVLDINTKKSIIANKEYSYAVKAQYTDCATQKQYSESYMLNFAYVQEVVSTRSTIGSHSHLENSLYNIEKSIQFMKNQSL